jgi:hypothetical protein
MIKRRLRSAPSLIALASAVLVLTPIRKVHGTTSDQAAPPRGSHFCEQILGSDAASIQLVDASATVVQLKSAAAAWTKISRIAPKAIKTDSLIVAKAYGVAAKAGTDTALRKSTVKAARTRVLTFLSKNCQSSDSPSGPEFEKVKACLEREGVTFPDDPSKITPDAKTIAALKKCGLAAGGPK